MEQYRKTLKNSLRETGVMLCLGSAVFLVGQQGYLSEFYPQGNFGDFFRGFHAGVFMALAVYLIASAVRICVILKDEKKLRADYVKNTDERNLKISELTGYKLYRSLIKPILVAAAAAGYFSPAVFFTLLAVSVFIITVTCFRWIYFSKMI